MTLSVHTGYCRDRRAALIVQRLIGLGGTVDSKGRWLTATDLSFELTEGFVGLLRAYGVKETMIRTKEGRR